MTHHENRVPSHAGIRSPSIGWDLTQSIPAIVIYGGLFYKANSPEAFAGVLLHEFGHILQFRGLNHGLTKITDRQFFEDEDCPFNFIADIFASIDPFVLKPYEEKCIDALNNFSRVFERNADEVTASADIFGIEDLMNDIVIIPSRGMQKYLDYPDYGVRTTHPLNTDRIDFIKKKVASLEKKVIKQADLSNFDFVFGQLSIEYSIQQMRRSSPTLLK